MKKNIISLSLIALSLAGCASTEVKNVVNKDYTDGQSLVDTARKTQGFGIKQPIVLPMSDTPYFGKTSIAASALKTELPRQLRNSVSVHFKTATPSTAEAFAQLITEETGLPVRVDQDTAGQGSGKPQFNVKTIDLSSLQPMPLNQLLNIVAPALGLDWDWYDGTLQLSRSFLRTYRLATSASSSKGKLMLGKTSQSQAGASTGNSGTGGNFTSLLDSSIDTVSNPWAEAEAGIKAIAGPTNVVPGPSLGILVVKCSKACHRQVNEYVETSNYILQQQVLFNVVEITVQSTSTGESGVNWNAVYQTLSRGRQYTFGFGSATSLVSNAAGSASVKILNPIGGTGSGFTDVSAIYNALSAASKVVESKPYETIATNNEPTTLGNTDQQSYTAATSVAITGTTGTPIYTKTPGYVTFGQLIRVTPTILPNGDISMLFGLDDTKLKQLDKGQAQGDIDSVLIGGLNLNTKAILRNGSTLILSGLKRNTATLKEQGVISGQRGGTEAASTERTETIIMITAYTGA